MSDNCTLKSLELYYEDYGHGMGEYFLKAVYERKHTDKKTEVVIPKIKLPVYSGEPTIKTPLKSCCISPESYIDLGFGDLLIISDNKNVLYTEKVIEYYPRKMTLEEIEKKLGYKVELVSNK